MSPDDALSIDAAARESPDRPALITATRSLTFAELAAACARVAPADDDHALPVLAHPDVATVVTVLAALATHRPVGLINPRAAATDRAAAAAALAAHPTPPGTLAVIFTSGTTGAPRGAVLSRAGLLAAAAASATNLGARADDRWLACLPLAHAGGLTVVLRALIARVPLILHDAPFDAAAVARLAAAHAATLTSLVPTQLDAVLEVPAWPPATLRAILLGGAAAPPALRARAAVRGVPVLGTYGLTETWGQVATALVATAGAADAAPRALPGVTLRAGTATAPAPIEIDAPWALTGWLGEPARPPAATLVTRDLGWLDDDGGLHVVGRADDVIITGGENVHPAQVEAALADAPGVAAACAFGIADPRWGEVVAAAIVPTPAGGDHAALRAWIAAHLPAHLRPRRLAFVAALPLGPTGKIDRRACARAHGGAATAA